MVFLLPWLGSIIAGTTDAPTQLSTHPRPKKEDITFILTELSKVLDVEVRLALELGFLVCIATTLVSRVVFWFFVMCVVCCVVCCDATCYYCLGGASHPIRSLPSVSVIHVLMC